MIMKESKRLLGRLKRKKNHMMIMFICINAANTSTAQHMNYLEKQIIYL